MRRRYSEIIVICSVFLILTLFLTACTPASAQHPVSLIGEVTPEPTIEPIDEAEYPTFAALAQAVLPPRDRIDLARRIYGLGEIPPPPSSAPVHQVGERQTFWTANLSGGGAFQVDATLRAVGEHIYIWVQDDTGVSDAAAESLAHAFDTQLYASVRELWGSEDSPGIDGDARVYALFAYGLGNSTGAYFAGDHTYPAEIVSNSNEHEMFFFNMDSTGTDIGSSYVTAVTAHEFQHMIRANIDDNEDNWLDEGFATFTELYLGFNTRHNTSISFLSVPQTQLNTWTEDGNRIPDYGASFLFTTYFYERYGLEAIRALSEDPVNGLASVDNVLRSIGEPGVDSFFADWVLANYLHAPDAGDGRYGYRLLWTDLPAPSPFAVATTYPFQSESVSNQYATHYYALNNLGDASNLDVSLTVPDTVQLVPTSAYSGEWMWYGNRGDNSDTTLTNAFNLSGVESATLNYRVWHHTEYSWDYAYVMVSADGERWDVLETAHTTLENLYGKSYGSGYTGASDGWITESVSLDDYAGGDVLVRFEMITDDAINQPGIVIDDVEIPEIGYFSDFETDGGGWESAGWIRTDNRLPQRVWVQAVQLAGGDFTVTRWMAPAEEGWTLELIDGVEQVVLAVSAFAPVTTVPARYTLRASTR